MNMSNFILNYRNRDYRSNEKGNIMKFMRKDLVNQLKNKSILFISPVFKQMIWGGSRLSSEFSYKIPGDDTGECWAVSAHPHGDCKVKEGYYEGKGLSELWKEHPELFGNVGLDRFPLLIKIIDAKEDLSIQVHPDGAYAKQHEDGSLGKMECWYILDCKEDAKLVIGHNASTKEELQEMITEGRWKDFIREVPVKKGDFIQTDPGTVHCIVGGTMVFEVQQNSDITYRVYDYDRLMDEKPRQLNVTQSIDVITVPAKPIEKIIKDALHLQKNVMNELISCEYYTVWKLEISETMMMQQEYPFLIMSVIEGEGVLNDHKIKKGDHFILPSGFGEIHMQGEMQLIATTIPMP